MTQPELAARCFLSYHRNDNKTYDGVADRLRTELTGRFQAETGRRLDVFIDRESIPGGGDWRENISASIAAATIFIPLITMNYFNSQACSEELLAFADGANRLGVTELILPVIVAGQDKITKEDPRPEVQLIERLNYRPIGDALDCGYQSPEWKQSIRRLVVDIATALETAEAHIAEKEGGRLAPSSEPGPSARGSRDGETEDPRRPNSPEDAEGAEANDGLETEDSGGDIMGLRESFEQLTATADEAMSALQDFGSAAEPAMAEVGDFSDLSPQQQKAGLLKLANVLRDPSNDLGAAGQRFQSQVRQVDADLRSIVRELSQIDGETAAEWNQAMLAPFQDIQDMDTAVVQMEDMANTLTALSLMNVSLRKSLAPAIRGLRAIKSGLSTAVSWRALSS